MHAGTLSLYLNGAPVAQQSGVVPMRVLSDTARADGLSVAGTGGKGAVDFTLSDLRISATARTPGVPTRIPTASALVVDPARPTGPQIAPLLLGGLHTLGAPHTEALAHGVLRVLRTDKLLTATPIKAGAPDAAHPSEGVSHAYSYDWQVVDRTFGYDRRLGILPYISLDATPEILGGSVPPFSGSLLLTGRSFASPFPPQVPRDMEAFGTMVRDLVHHVVVERHDQVPYWSVWNEPDGPDFWKGTLADYLRLYDVVARAVKSVNDQLQVGGPETATWDPTWLPALIQHAASAHVPLDFVSWHYYSGNLGELSQASSQLAQWAAQSGLPAVPKLLVGEWSWQLANVPGTGVAPWRNYNYFVNDWAGAFAASSLIEMQHAGVMSSVYANPVAELGTSGSAASGLMSARHPWAPLNTFALWSMLGHQPVASQLRAVPGVSAQASTDGAGRLTVLLSRLQYRPGPAVPLDVLLPGAGGRLRRHYVVDARRSDAYDAGAAHASLQAISDSQHGARIRVWLAPRSVHMVVIDTHA
jgi:hypothetical protein